MSLTRKYVDLIYELTGKFPTLDPSISAVQLGDFGKFDHKTGAWETRGNIFKEGLAKEEEVAKTGGTEEFRVCSHNAKEIALSSSADTDAASIVGAGASVRYEFSGRRGALVYVPQMACRYIDIASIFNIAKHPLLSGKYLVVQTWHAPSFVTYVSQAGGSSITISLNANAPVVAVPGLNAGGSVAAKFQQVHNGGIYRFGFDPDGKQSYTPFFVVREPPKSLKDRILFRDSPEPEEISEGWQPSVPPWGDLDDEGEEIPPEAKPKPVFF